MQYTRRDWRNRKELVRKVGQAGFEVIRTTSFVSLLFPLLLFARLSRHQTQDNFDPMAEFRINPVLNMLLENVLDIERFFIKQGFSFPLGGSLVVIDKRPHR